MPGRLVETRTVRDQALTTCTHTPLPLESRYLCNLLTNAVLVAMVHSMVQMRDALHVCTWSTDDRAARLLGGATRANALSS